MNKFVLTAGISLLGISAHAQLVFGHTYYSSGSAAESGAFYMDANTGATTQLWSGAGSRKVNGIAADDANNKMYANDAARLLVWDYGAVGTKPTQINGFYRTGHDNVVYVTGVDDLCLANGGLYAYTTYNASGGTQVDDGIYIVDTTVTTSATQNLSLVWSHSDLDYNFQGITFDAATGLFYGANQTGNNHSAGIYSIDALGTGAVNRIMDFPTDITSADGITFGDGRLWVSQKVSGNSYMSIRGYNLSTSSWDRSFNFGTLFPSQSYATGLSWANTNPVPEPATLFALGAGAIALLKKRRAR